MNAMQKKNPLQHPRALISLRLLSLFVSLSWVLPFILSLFLSEKTRREGERKKKGTFRKKDGFQKYSEQQF